MILKPMLATLVAKPFDDPEWIFEIKWDGYRVLAYKKMRVTLLSRNKKSFNEHFPILVKELQKLPGPFVLDGEVVVLDQKGRSHFQLLQNYQKQKNGPIYYFIFDILSYKGKDLTGFPLIERKKFLKKLLQKYPSKHLCFSDHITGKGKKIFQLAKRRGLEGIIAKRKESLYRPIRSKDWLKIKTKQRQEVVIGGFTAPRGTRKYFGSLLVGIYEKKKLIYCGHVGGGFNEKLLKQIYDQLIPLACNSCPFQTPPRSNTSATWVKPKLVCEVAFAEWTSEKMMRQPIFQGLRIDKSAKDVMRETVSPKK